MKWLLRTLAVFLFLPSVFLNSARAQTNPNVEQGFTSYGSYDSTEYSSVNLANGNLVLKVPLFDYPQRGSLSGKLYMVMNGHNFVVIQNCNKMTGVCTDHWKWTGIGGINFTPLYITNLQDVSIFSKAIPQYGISAFSARTWDGAMHQMGIKLGVVGNETVDGTNIYDNGLAGSSNLILMGNGNQPAQDTNGNQSIQSNDTLGRNLSPTAGPDSGTVGCRGPKPIVSYLIYAYPGVSGGSRLVKICFATISLQTNFQIRNVDINPLPTEIIGAAGPMAQSVIVYNGTDWTTSPAWIFEYDSRNVGDPQTINYDDLTKVTLPSGGTISYTWNTITCDPSAVVTPASRAVSSVTIDANDGTGPHTTTYAGIGSSTVTATGPAPFSDQTVHSFGPANRCPKFETQTQFYQGSSTLLKTVNTDYRSQFNPLDTSTGDGSSTVIDVWPIRVTTTIPNGATPKVSKIEKDYDSNLQQTWPPTGQFNESYGNVTEMREFDWGDGAPGPLLRKTDYTYLAFVNSAYNSTTVHMMDRVKSVTVFDGSSNQLAQTVYNYDAGTPDSSGVATRHVALPAGTLRGNQTSVQKWVNTTGTLLTTSSTRFYDTGMPHVVTDALGNQTTYTYSSTFAGAYATQTQFPTTNSITHIVSGNYDFNTGLLTSFTDQNNQPSSYSYDNLSRITTATYPDGGQTTLSYVDVAPTSATLTKKITSSLNLVKTSKFDGLGRTIQTQLASDPEGIDYTDTTYDAVGRVATVSNPHRTGALSTDGITTYRYDALGRVCVVVPPDGTVPSGNTCPVTAPTNDMFTLYAGNTTTVTDQAGKTRKNQTNGIGQLTSVWEDPAVLNYQTVYTYDVLNNLKSVVQAGSRNRTFTYNSLSQLLTAVNPESGTLRYTYDNNGNMKTKIAPLPNQTGASTVTTTYSYDALNRNTQKSYSDGTPTANFYFDTAPSFWVASEQNTVGRLVEATTINTATELSYDSVGRISQKAVCTPFNCTVGANGQTGQGWVYTYNYNLAGGMTQFEDGVYVFPQYFNQTFDGAGRVSQLTSTASDAQHPATFFTADGTNGYFPNGALRKATLGNGLTLSNVYDKRLQPCLIDVANNSALLLLTCNDGTPSGNVLDLYTNYNLGVSDNGNIFGWNATGAETFVRTYGYDALNRVSTFTDSAAAQACKGLSWTYDAWGNRTNQNMTSGTCGQFHPGVNANNQLTDPINSLYQYDAAGNMTHDASHSYAYDAENRVKTVDGGATASYVYDAFGRRAKRTVGANSYEYVYDNDGNIGWELLNGSVNHAYIRSNGELLAEYFEGTTYFSHADHLGSTRLLTRLDKTIRECDDYYPYGESNACTGLTTGTPLKFTGKERDTESGLDNFEARYMSSSMGRFMTPDWSAAPMGVPYADFGNPQSLNLYSYVKNNPLSVTDPDGHCCEDAMQLGRDIAAVPTPVTEAVGALVIAGAVVGAIISNPGARQDVADTFNNVVDAYASSGGHSSSPYVGPIENRGTSNQTSQSSSPADSGQSTPAHPPEDGEGKDTTRAARREAMRQEGIPTSQQPNSQTSKDEAGRQYTYEVPKAGGGTQTKIVTNQHKDENHGPHVEAGAPKANGQTDRAGRLRHANPKTKVNVNKGAGS